MGAAHGGEGDARDKGRVDNVGLLIDGSQGEGGGQIIRSALALSAVSGQPLRIHDIRARRSKPGLRRQHLVAVQAIAQICQAEVTNAAVGARELTFQPGSISAGEYRFDIGSAGSTTLVFQTILPALLLADGPSQVTLIGGTHNPLAPPFDFLQLCYLPILRKLGITVTAELIRPGFYPVGGGQLRFRVTPHPSWRSLQLCDRGELLSPVVRAVVAGLPKHIAQRECDTIAKATGWPASAFHVQALADPVGPGNVVTIELACEGITELFTGFGRRGVPAERVALEALQPAQQYLDSAACVGPHLADQLLLPIALSVHFAGHASRFRTPPLTGHAITHIDILQRFLSVRIDTHPITPQLVEVAVAPT